MMPDWERLGRWGLGAVSAAEEGMMTLSMPAAIFSAESLSAAALSKRISSSRNRATVFTAETPP